MYSNEVPTELLNYLSETVCKIYFEEEGIFIDTIVLCQSENVYNFAPLKEKTLKTRREMPDNKRQYNLDKYILKENFDKYGQIALLINYDYHYHENQVYKLIGKFEIIGVENEGFFSNSFFLGYTLNNGFEINSKPYSAFDFFRVIKNTLFSVHLAN
jgi:hypothetical protein